MKKQGFVRLYPDQFFSSARLLAKQDQMRAAYIVMHMYADGVSSLTPDAIRVRLGMRPREVTPFVDRLTASGFAEIVDGSVHIAHVEAELAFQSGYRERQSKNGSGRFQMDSNGSERKTLENVGHSSAIDRSQDGDLFNENKEGPQATPRGRAGETVTVTVTVKDTSDKSDFEAFWKAWRKGVDRPNDGKAAAKRKYDAAVKVAPHAAIMAEMQKLLVFYEDEGTEPQHRKHASTWLNSVDWSDAASPPPVERASDEPIGFATSIAIRRWVASPGPWPADLGPAPGKPGFCRTHAECQAAFRCMDPQRSLNRIAALKRAVGLDEDAA